MTRNETKEILRLLKAAYPESYRNQTDKSLQDVINLWTDIFRDEPVELVAAAVKKHINEDEQGFHPTIGSIRKAIVRMLYPEAMSDEEALSRIVKAVSNGIYHAYDEFSELPDILQRTVGTPSQIYAWAQMDETDFQRTVAPRLQRTYRHLVESQYEQQLMPQNLRETIDKLQAAMSLQDTAALPAADDPRRGLYIVG